MKQGQGFLWVWGRLEDIEQCICFIRYIALFPPNLWYLLLMLLTEFVSCRGTWTVVCAIYVLRHPDFKILKQ